MKYLPALIAGLLLALLITYTFSILSSYSPLIEYIKSMPELNAYSLQWLLMLLNDTVISLICAALILFSYRKLLSGMPFNWLAILLMQLPVATLCVVINGFPISFSSSYETARSLASLVTIFCVVLLYTVTFSYNKKR
jgi:hypothetical protein